MKIVGVGLNKTGTTTLGVCLHQWGLKHLSFSTSGFQLYREHNFEEIWRIVDRYDSFEDWPWPLMYREMDQQYPGSRFILTTRQSSEKWFDSLCKHSERSENRKSEFRIHIYGYEMPREHKAEHIEFYESHNERVRQYFRDRPEDFLEICWENGEGWDELSEFLEFNRPNKPFPHAGKSPTNPIEHVIHRMKQLIRRR